MANPPANLNQALLHLHNDCKTKIDNQRQELQQLAQDEEGTPRHFQLRAELIAYRAARDALRAELDQRRNDREKR